MSYLVLASGSPRRRELLGRLLERFEILTSAVEETGSAREPELPIPPLELPAPYNVPIDADPRLWAWRKATDVAEQYAESLPPGMLVLGADTVVIGPGEVLGKPSDQEHAFRMLCGLRGRWHYVP